MTINYDPKRQAINVEATFAYGIYTVTLDPKGGTIAAPGKSSYVITNSEDATWSFLPEVSKTGYNFGGWYDGDTKVTSSSDLWLTADKTLTAKWTAINYTLTVTKPAAGINKLYYKVGNGNWKETSSSFNESVPCGSTYAWYAVADTGYTTTYASEQEPCAGTMPAGPVAYSVEVTQKSYTLTFSAGGGQVIETNGTRAATITRTMHYNQVFGTMPSATLDSEHKFDGWYDQENGGTQYSATSRYPLDDNLSLYAHWTTADKYVISGVASPTKGGTVSGGGSYYSGQTVTLIAAAKKGYTFDRWENGDDEPTREIVVRDVGATYTAYFTPNDYRVFFDAVRPEASVSPMEKDVTFDNEFGDLPVPTCPDYEFLGWYSTATYDAGTEITAKSIVTMTGKPINLYAKWKKIPVYYVAFDGNGATDGLMATQKIVRNTWTALTSNAFSRTGYEYGGGWTNVNRDVYHDGELVKNIAEEDETATLYAKWTPNKYHVVFNSNGQRGTMEPLSNCTYDVAFDLPENQYYHLSGEFLGWSTNAAATAAEWEDGERVVNLATNGTVMLFAVWKDLVNDLTRAAHGKNVILTTGGKNVFTVYTNDTGYTSVKSGLMSTESAGEPFRYWSGLELKVSGAGTLTYRYRYSRTPEEHGYLFGYVTYWVDKGKTLAGSLNDDGWYHVREVFVADTGGANSEHTIRWLVASKTPEDYLLIDQVVWTPEGDHDVPTEEDKPMIGGFSPSAFGGFALSFVSDARFDYRLLSTLTLTPPDWQPYGEVKQGTGAALVFEVPAGREGTPGTEFFKVEVLQRGAK